MNFLSETLVSTRRAVENRRRKRPIEIVRAGVPDRPDERIFRKALGFPGISVIAEFKRQWPSAEKRHLPHDPDLREIVRDYERAGAHAVSVLTEGSKFGGSHEDLRVASDACGLPILDKDFIVEDYQVYEAAEAGADAILLIGAAFKDEPDRLRALHGLARRIRLDVLVEVRSKEELDRALDIGADLIGINNRDLDTLRVDRETTQQLVAHIPTDAGVTIVSESGLRVGSDLDRLDERVNAALIGAVLMTANDRYAMCRKFVDAGAAKGADSAHPAFA